MNLTHALQNIKSLKKLMRKILFKKYKEKSFQMQM